MARELGNRVRHPSSLCHRLGVLPLRLLAKIKVFWRVACTFTFDLAWGHFLEIVPLLNSAGFVYGNGTGRWAVSSHYHGHYFYMTESWWFWVSVSPHFFLKNCVVWWCYQLRGTAWISAFFLCIPLWHNFCSLTMLKLCLHAILWCDKDKVFSHKSLTYNYVHLQGVTWSVLITGWFTMAFLYLLRGPSPWLNFIFHGKK